MPRTEIRLVASLIVRNEAGRYLDLTVPALLEFCDEVLALDDNSTDGTAELLRALRGVKVVPLHLRPVDPGHSGFYEHEGLARQALYELTLLQQPTHVLAVDADEFVSDGQALRSYLQGQPEVAAWSLDLDEVWRVERDCLCLRVDGGWRPHPVAALYAVQASSPHWRFAERALACGRVPAEVEYAAAAGYGLLCELQILHFGWANPGERAARHARYALHDQGRFHASAHLDSILDEQQVRLAGRDWPTSLTPLKEDLMSRCQAVSF
jgi:hypothetical protein